MTKTIIAIALAAIMVVGTLGFNPGVFAANPNANEASPANGGVSNGLPFTNLQEQIDAINAEIDDLVADNDVNIAALQAQIDALSDDVEANTDEIAVLENILGTNCGSGAIRAILSDGTVLCIAVNESEGVVMGRVFGNSVNPTLSIPATSSATCPTLVGRATGGGWDNLSSNSDPNHAGPNIQESFATSTVTWTVTGLANDQGHGIEHFRAVVSCMSVI